MEYTINKKVDEFYLKRISECLLGSGGFSCFQRAAQEIKFQRNYNDENLSALRSMLSGYEGVAMASAFWPWEGRLKETVHKKKEQFVLVMLRLGIKINEIAVLLEGNPRHNK
jgi:hypothetical protein